MRLPVTVFQGRRRFAWRPLPLEDGRRAWLRLVFQLQPVGGIRPTFRGRPVAYTDRLPHCDPSWRGWLRTSRGAQTLGRLRSMQRRIALYLGLWLVMLAAITELVGWVFRWPAAFGGLHLGAVAVYLPGQFLAWHGLVRGRGPWIIDAAMAASILCAVAVGARVWLDLRRLRRPRSFGAERWAGPDDVRRSGLL